MFGAGKRKMMMGPAMMAGQQGSGQIPGRISPAQKPPYMEEGPHTQVNPNNSFEQNWQIVQKYGGDANYSMFERMYGDERTQAQQESLYGPADGLSPFNSYDQNIDRMRGDSDAALMDFYYNPQRSTNPSPYTEGIISPEKTGPAEYGYRNAMGLLGFNGGGATQVSPSNDEATNRRIAQKNPTDANMMMLEEMYGGGTKFPTEGMYRK